MLDILEKVLWVGVGGGLSWVKVLRVMRLCVGGKKEDRDDRPLLYSAQNDAEPASRPQALAHDDKNVIIRSFFFFLYFFGEFSEIRSFKSPERGSSPVPTHFYAIQRSCRAYSCADRRRKSAGAESNLN